LLTAISPGDITVSVSTLENGTTLISSISINVSNNTLAIRDISSLSINESHQYIVNFEGTSTITWSSSDPSIARINATGLVTALRQGYNYCFNPRSWNKPL